MSTLLRSVLPRGSERRWLALAVLLSAGATGAAIALLSTSGYLISRAAQRPTIISLMVTITAVRAFGLARAALRYSERLASHELALRQLARLRTSFYRRLAPLVPAQLQGHGRGDLLTRFVADVDTLQDAHLRVGIPVLVASLVILGASFAGWLMLPAAGAGLLLTLVVAAVLSPLLSARVAAVSGRDQAPARSALTAQLVEAIDGSAELALAGRAREHASRLERSDARLAALGRRDALAGALAGGLASLLAGAGLIAVLLIATAAVRAGTMPGVLLAAVALLFLGATEALDPLPAAARRLRACATAAARLEDVCAKPPGIRDPVAPEHPRGPAAPERLRGSAGLALESVTLTYGPDEPAVLEDVSLVLGPGERVALVGASGAGKTTLAELLVRFLDPVAGRVTLDGLDIRRIRQGDLRRDVLLCGQDAHLFNTTIRENLLLARREASEAELWTALRAVELDHFVATLPDGLDALVGQGGELVSGGQRQRIALARALVSGSRFLVLDEPTAHLDGELARRVMHGVFEHAAGRGLLAITHATGSLDAFDRVLRLERGTLQP